MSGKDDPTTKGNAARPGSLNKFLPGGELGPITNREKYQGQAKSLQPDQREFAEESARFADLWQYFAEHRMQLPENVVAEVTELSKLARDQQLTVLRNLNHRLMEYLHDASEDSGVRQ